jgi:hypothetical protein
MKLRALTLGSAALAGTLFLAGAAFAAPNDYYNTNPTPQERQQTDRLNGNAANQAHSDADDSVNAANANAANQANYDRDRAAYNRDRADSDAQRAAYEQARARYDAAHGGYAHRWDAFYGYNRFRDVMAMQSRDIMGLTVSTRGGNRVGRVRDVDTDPRGRITRVSIGLGGGNRAWIDADDLRFDPSSRALLTDLTRDQVNDMAHMRYPRF